MYIPQLEIRPYQSRSPIMVGVVNSNAPMLIPHESMKRMKGEIDFPSRALPIPSVAKIQLANRPNTHSGHHMIHGTRPSVKLCEAVARKPHPVYVMEMKLPAVAISVGEIKKIQVKLGHFPENTLSTTILADRMPVGPSGIRKVLGISGCQTSIRRIAPPSAAFWLAK